jgi:hypothetical protein
MIRMLICISCGFAMLFFNSVALAQTDGNPQLKIPPIPLAPIEKSPSKLSAPLTRLFESYAVGGLTSNARATACGRPGPS